MTTAAELRANIARATILRGGIIDGTQALLVELVERVEALEAELVDHLRDEHNMAISIEEKP